MKIRRSKEPSTSNYTSKEIEGAETMPNVEQPEGICMLPVTMAQVLVSTSATASHLLGQIGDNVDIDLGTVPTVCTICRDSMLPQLLGPKLTMLRTKEVNCWGKCSLIFFLTYLWWKERKEILYLTTHSTHFIYGYMHHTYGKGQFR